MGRFGRFFVNRFKGRANERLFHWVRQHLVLPDGSECLEIGAGKGDMASQAVQAYHPIRYIATDYDPAQVETARRFLTATRSGGLPPALELRTADALRLDFPDETFDAIFAFAMLHHVGEHGATLSPSPTRSASSTASFGCGPKKYLWRFRRLRDWIVG